MASAAAYLTTFGVESAIAKAVTEVLIDRPADPVAAIGQILLAAGNSKPTIPMRSLGAQQQKIPSLGFGVGTAWFKSSDEKKPVLISAVQSALDAGFTHLDEAEMYMNEKTTGKALQEWLAQHPEMPRSALHITSKVFSIDADGGIEAVCKCSLQALGCDYFDLYLIHAPFQKDGTPHATPLPDAWAQMEALVEKGLCKAIGVSNWRVSDLASVYDAAKIKPCCNQIEAHPYLQQPALERYCADRSIMLAAYAPLAPLTKVLLRWSLQTAKLPITTTSKPERLIEYQGAFGFELSEAEVAAISAAGAQSPKRLYWTPVASWD